MSRASTTSSVAGAILARVIRSEESDLPQAAAKAFLRFAFSERDQARMHEIVTIGMHD